MDRINVLKQSRIEAEQAFSELLDSHLKAADGKRPFSEEEKTAQASAEALVKSLDDQVAAEEKRLSIEKTRAANGPRRIEVKAPNFTEDPRKGFKTHREFLQVVRGASMAGAPEGVSDERARFLAVKTDDGIAIMLPLALTPPSMRSALGRFSELEAARFQAAIGSDEQSTTQDAYGGAAVPGPQMLGGMLQVGFEGDPTAGRTQPVPMAVPHVEMLARTDKNHQTSVSGGFTVGRRAELTAPTSSRGAIEKVALKAAMLAGLAYESEELIADSFISFVAFIEAGFRDQFSHRVLSEKIRGLGGDEYLGVLTALSSATLGPTVSIAKEAGQAAASIVADNVLKMRARCWGYGNAIWLANHDTYPQLAKLSIPVGTGGGLIYQQSLQENRPDMLLGRPIFYSEYPSTVGSQGDLILGNWSQYLEGVYQPLQSAESIHVRFVNHERTFKFWLRNAGAPWWRVPLTPHKGASTLSPFVVLDVRS